jgi:hypothetical protein
MVVVVVVVVTQKLHYEYYHPLWEQYYRLMGQLQQLHWIIPSQ